MGTRFMNLDTESQAEAKHRKGDKFDARIQIDAADQSWNRAYEYTRATANQNLLLSPDTRRTSPSTYLEGSGSSSAHTVDQGHAGPARPPRVVTYQPGPSEQMEIVDHGQEEYRYGGNSQGRHGGHRSERGSHRSSGRSGRRSRQGSHKSSRTGDDGCCILM